MAEPQVMSQDTPVSDELWLELVGPGELRPLEDYVDAIANRELRKYRNIVQWGKKPTLRTVSCCFHTFC